jgi:isopenicillin N synthase-like dioxygenase
MMDLGIPVARLSTISLVKLRAKDPVELIFLDKAASNTGFFYLDLREDSEGKRVLAHLPDVYAVAEKYFSQPQETKAKDVRHDNNASQDLGWKKCHGGESFEVSIPCWLIKALIFEAYTMR